MSDEIKSHFNLSRPKVTFCQKETYEDYKRAASTLGLDTLVFTFDGDNSMKEIIDKYDEDAPIDDFEPAIFDLDKVYAWLVSSGGTSGVIKLAAFKHKVWLDKVPSFVLPMLRKSGDCVNEELKTTLNLSPVQWVSGFFNAIGPILNNAIKVQTSAPATVEHVIDIINKYKPASTLIGPSLLTTIVRHEKKCDFTCFDALLIGGGKVYKDILIKTRKLTREPTIVLEMYGQSENLGPIFAPNPSGPLGSCGRCIPSVLIKLVDPETGKEIIEPHTPGELWTKTACFTEYYNNPVETALAFSEDGYYKTGDLLYKDEEDNYFFVERLKMLIKYRSYHIIPPELEEVIRTHSAVRDVSVVGLPNEQDGEWPVACVIIKNGTKVTAKEIEDLIADEIKSHFQISRPKVAFCEKENFADYKEAARALELDTFVFTFDGETSMKEIIEKYDDCKSIDDFEPAIFDLDKIYLWLASTGGTGGILKLAAIKHKVWLHKVLNFVMALYKNADDGFSENDKSQSVLNISPIHWISGLFNALKSIISNQIKVQTSAPLTTEHLIDIINNYKPASTLISPSQITSILRHEKKCDLTSFDSLLITGGKIYNDILLEVRQLTRDPKIAVEAYGQTENLGPILIPNPLGPIGNCGKIMPSILIKLVDPVTGKEITAPNTPGELWNKPTCFSEYYNNPDETAMVFSEDGYYKTGDILYRDEQNNFFFVERLKMLIKYRNYHIIPLELEEVIRTHPGVQDASVTGIPHAVDGDWPVACVVSKAGAKVLAKEIEDLVADKLSDSKRLRGGVIFMDQLPYMSTGKLARGKLHQMVIDIKNKI